MTKDQEIEMLKAQLTEAVGLLRFAYDHAEQHEDGGSDPWAGFGYDVENGVQQQEAKPTAEQLAELKRFYETCTDGEAYDVPVETMHQLATMGLVDPAPEHGEHGFSMNAEGRAALATEQEAQGARAGGEPVGTFKSFEALLKNIEATWFAGADLIRSRDTAQRKEITELRAALATQPAAGEPVAVLYKDGTVLTRADCQDEQVFRICCKVETPLYTAPPAAAHGDEAVRIDARLLELYQTPFRFDERGGYIWDAQNNMVADNHVDGDQAMRVRGWGRLSYRKDGEEVQDLMGHAMADALTARWEAAMRAQGDGE